MTAAALPAGYTAVSRSVLLPLRRRVGVFPPLQMHHHEQGRQRYRCGGCGRTFTSRTATPFSGYRWPWVVIGMAVRWYTCYRLSTANVRDLLAERYIDVSERTVLGWVHTFGPLLAAEGRRQARPLGTRWWCDETYVRVGGEGTYLYRAVDEDGQVVDVLLRSQRDLASAKAFFAQAVTRCSATPGVVITDKHPAYPRAIREQIPQARHIRTGLHRASGPTCLPIERLHVPIKDRLRPMRGLQSIRTGQRIVESIELAGAIRRGDVGVRSRQELCRLGLTTRARAVRAIFDALAGELRSAA